MTFSHLLFSQDLLSIKFSFRNLLFHFWYFWKICIFIKSSIKLFWYLLHYLESNCHTFNILIIFINYHLIFSFIFFFPFRAMVLPASPEEGKLLKKKYAVHTCLTLISFLFVFVSIKFSVSISVFVCFHFCFCFIYYFLFSFLLLILYFFTNIWIRFLFWSLFLKFCISINNFFNIFSITPF